MEALELLIPHSQVNVGYTTVALDRSVTHYESRDACTGQTIREICITGAKELEVADST